MLNDITVSVIIPSFDRRDSLRVALHSLNRQTYPPSQYEVIVVDDGSHDGTAQMLRSLKTGLRYRLVVLRSSRSGPGHARNLAIAAAHGEILLFTDSDCIPDPSWISFLSKAAGTTNSAAGGRIEVTDEATWVARMVNYVLNCWLGGFGMRWRAFGFVPGYRLRTMNAAVLRTAAESVGGFQCSAGCYGEDTELGEALERQGYVLHHCDAAVVVHQEDRTPLDYCGEALAKGMALARLVRRRSIRLRGIYVGPVALVGLLAVSSVNLIGQGELAEWQVVPMLAYTVVVQAYGIKAVRKLGSVVPLFLLPIVACALHVSYGLGVLLGFAGLGPPAKGVRAPSLKRFEP